MNRPWVIYVLVDPRNGKIRYVGKTVEPQKRVRWHMNEAANSRDNSYRLNWLRSLAAANLKPTMTIVETGIGDWERAERQWIKKYQVEGAELVNGTPGGEGWTAGMRRSEENRAKVSASKRGKKRPPFSEEWKANMRAAQLGKKKTEETKAKIAAAHMGMRYSAETKEKIAVANRGKNLSPAHRAKISDALRGRPKSPERRAQMLAASRAYWAKKTEQVLPVGQNKELQEQHQSQEPST